MGFIEKLFGRKNQKASPKSTILQRLCAPSRKKDFRCDKKEIFLRSWWLAHKVTDATVDQFAPTAISSWIKDERFRELDQKLLPEVIGYSMSFVIDKLRDEIEESHGWTDETYEIHIGYQVSLGMAFDQVFGFEAKGEGVFVEILDDYYSLEYDDGYDDLWEVCNEPEDVWGRKTVGDLLNEPLSEKDYNAERYYVYRLSKMVDVVDPNKVIDDVLPYRDLGLAFYDKAFFGLNLRSVEEELKQLVNR